MSFLNQIANSVGVLPTAITTGFIGSQAVTTVAGKKPLSPFSGIMMIGLSFVSYGYLMQGSFEFIKKDMDEFLTEMEKIPDAVEGMVSSVVDKLTPAPQKKQQETIFGIPI